MQHRLQLLLGKRFIIIINPDSETEQIEDLVNNFKC